MNGKNITDMTTGSPIRHILKFALPLVVGNLFQQFYNMVDAIVVGNYVSADALAAVGNCSSMNFLGFSLTSGIAIGIGVIVAQYFGAKDDDNVRVTIANSIYVLVSAALVVTVLGYIFCPALFRLLQTPEKIMEDSVVYMRTTCLGILGITIYNGVAAILRALGDSKTPLYFLIVSCIINIVLDLLFVLVFDLAVLGVAIATVIAQVVSAVACLYYAYKKVSYFRLTKMELRPNKAIISRSFKLGIPIALQNSMIAISCMVLQGYVNTFKEKVMAAFTVINKMEMIVQQPYGSLGAALTTYAGQNMGAGKIHRVKKGFGQSVLVVLIFSALLLPIAFLFGKPIVGLFVKEKEVIDIGYQALRITSLCYFALGMIYVPRALLNGCGDTNFAMANGFCEVACRILYAPLFTSIPMLGYWGLWVTTGATWVTTSIFCVIRYFSGAWKKKGIVDSKRDILEI